MAEGSGENIFLVRDGRLIEPEITPVVEVDRRAIGAGAPGPLTRALQKRFFACASGEDAAHPGWLTAVNAA